MNTDKSLLPVDGSPLIEHIVRQLIPHFDQVLVSAGEPEKYAFLEVEVVTDDIPDQGPLVGMIASITESRNDLNFVQACDIPAVNMDLVGQIIRLSSGVDAVAPRSSDGRLEPLFAVYRKSVLPVMEGLRRKNIMRATAVLHHCNVRFVDLDQERDIRNLNTPDDYQSYLQSRSFYK